MADISKITLPSNTTYNIKDATARTEVAGKQNVITADGILQGDGEGNITAADTASTSTLSNPSSNGTYVLQNTVSGGTSTLSWASDSGNSGTVTSVGVSNNTNGGLTVSGSPITDSGTITIGHSNVLTNAQTTQAVYPIKIDKNGHISSYGSAVTIPDVSGKIDTAGTGLSKSGTTLNHSNSITAQSTSGVYPIKIDAQGHITEYGSAISYITPPSTVSAGDVLTYDSTNGWIATAPDSGLPAQSSSTDGKILQSTYDSSTSTASASWESLEPVSTLTVDSAPVASSTNLVTSGGVYSAISNIEVLPSQTNNSGKFLTTNGTSASWATVSIPTVPTMDASPTDGNSSNTVSSNGVYDMVMGRTKIYTATCSSAADASTKVATLDDSTGFSLTAGVTVLVRFTYGNSATTPTLNVNGTGGKNIAIPSSTTAFTTTTAATIWGAYESILFTYTGTYWTHVPSGYLGYLAYNKADNAVPKTVSSNPGNSTISHTWSGFSISIITDVNGSNSFAVNSDSTEIHNVVTPTANGDAVPKSYVDNAISNIDALPSQTDNSGKFLTTNGSVASWATILIPSTVANATTGISISDHSTTSIYGVQSSTTTASKASGANGTAPTLGTPISIPNVTSTGSASNWVFEDVTVPKAATSATTVPIKDASATSIPNVTAVGSGSFSATVTNHVLSFSHAHTAPTLGTAISVTGVQSNTTSVTGVSGSVTGSHVKSGGNGTAPTLGTAISVPNVTSVGSASTWSFSDVTVPIKNSSSTTVVTSKTHSVTDSGHTHTLS